jgi:hypothetical protein
MARRDTERNPAEQNDSLDRGNEGRMPADDEVRGVAEEGDDEFEDADDLDDEEEGEGDGSF